MYNIWQKTAVTSQFILSLILISGQCHLWYKSCSLQYWCFLVPLYWNSIPVLPDYFHGSLSSLTTLYFVMFLCFGLAVGTLNWKPQQCHGQICIKIWQDTWAGSKWSSRQGVCYNELFHGMVFKVHHFQIISPIFVGQILIIWPKFWISFESTLLPQIVSSLE